MAVKTYDPKEVILTVGGVPIGGYADGTFISFERSNDAYTMISGADGETSRAKSNDKNGSLTLTLAQTSDSNAVLSGIAQLDEKSNAGVVPILLKEVNGDTTILSASGWIRKFPTVEYAKEITNREWIIDIANVEVFVGGNQGVFSLLG